MTIGRPTYGIVEGQTPPVVHRFGNISGRSCCGKTLVPLPDGPKTRAIACQRCSALEKARREALPDWY
jgi:hypothetical protein